MVPGIIVYVTLLVFLLALPQAYATGIMLPDMGLDIVIIASFGALAVAVVLWAALRPTRFWKLKLASNPGLAILAKINPPLVLIVIAASVFSFWLDSWLLLVPMFVGVPIVIFGILVELVWGFMTRVEHQDD